MGRRTNTAKWLENQKRWQVNVQKDGKRRSFYSSTPGRTGQREANAKADAWLDEGIHSRGERVSELYEVFLKEQKEIANLCEYKKLKSQGNTWVLPYLGKKKVLDLNDGDIQTVLDKAAAMGRSRKTVKNINGSINKFLKWCRRHKKTAYRPDDIHIPTSARYKGKSILQPNDLITLLSVDTTIYRDEVMKDPLIHAYRFQVMTGLRPSEMRGLRIEDLDGRKLNIQRAINSFGEETKGKNENAIRSFVLSDMAHKELKAQIQEYPSKSGYIFDLPNQNVYLRHWKRYCEVNHLTQTTTYELRHTFVSVVKALSEGEVKQLVGHSNNMDTFDVYGHKLLGEDVITAEKVNGLFQKIVKAEEDGKK